MENQVKTGKHFVAFDKMLTASGYQPVEKYEHDQFYTYRYRKGPLQVELTFKDGEMVSSDIAIDEMIIQTDSKGIEEITRVLSKYMDHS